MIKKLRYRDSDMPGQSIESIAAVPVATVRRAETRSETVPGAGPERRVIRIVSRAVYLACARLIIAQTWTMAGHARAGSQ